MLDRRLKEILGIMMIGEGVLSLLYPRQYVALWRGGPRWWDKTMDAFIDHPDTTRAVGALEAGLGLWLAQRQLSR